MAKGSNGKYLEKIEKMHVVENDLAVNTNIKRNSRQGKVKSSSRLEEEGHTLVHEGSQSNQTSQTIQLGTDNYVPSITQELIQIYQKKLQMTPPEVVEAQEIENVQVQVDNPDSENLNLKKDAGGTLPSPMN